MNISKDLLNITSWMADEFSNREQSLDQPVWFVNLGFEVSADEFCSGNRGINPETG